MKREIPNKKLSNIWSIMISLKTYVQLLGGNKLWFNHLRKIAKGLLKCPTIIHHFGNQTTSGVRLSVIIAAVNCSLKLTDLSFGNTC